MVKITAKLIKNNKTIKTASYNSVNEYDSNEFYNYVCHLAQVLDVETPVIIPYHRECFENFNSLKLLPDDFIDAVNFDYMFLENDDR
jgi:preprotein translocase subunit SecB